MLSRRPTVECGFRAGLRNWAAVGVRTPGPERRRRARRQDPAARRGAQVRSGAAHPPQELRAGEGVGRGAGRRGGAGRGGAAQGPARAERASSRGGWDCGPCAPTDYRRCGWPCCPPGSGVPALPTSKTGLHRRGPRLPSPRADPRGPPSRREAEPAPEAPRDPAGLQAARSLPLRAPPALTRPSARGRGSGTGGRVPGPSAAPGPRGRARPASWPLRAAPAPRAQVPGLGPVFREGVREDPCASDIISSFGETEWYRFIF